MNSSQANLFIYLFIIYWRIFIQEKNTIAIYTFYLIFFKLSFFSFYKGFYNKKNKNKILVIDKK